MAHSPIPGIRPLRVTDQLTALNLEVRKMDLRIAAVALENGGVLVSRNLRDFRRIPNLTVEDWAV